MNKKLTFILSLFAMALSACNGGGSKKCETPIGDELHATPLTDKLDFAQKDSLEGAKFAGHEGEQLDHYGYVTLRSVTDGDTANFVQEGYVDAANAYVTIKTRFLGVNTPESTAKVEPWGKKASNFTKHVLTEAQAIADQETASSGQKVYNIALITDADPEKFGERDSSGNRWLAFVWYRLGSTSKWRNLNLELVEQGYSRNQNFTDSNICNYRQAFEKAGENAEKCGYRVNGQVDKDYDYTATTYEYSLWGVIHHFSEIGITEEGSSGYQLIVTALVVGIQGDSLYLRDVLIDEEQHEAEGENARYAGLYAYAGFNSALCSTLQNASERYGGDGTGVGLIVRFYCRATMYSGNVQLSDLKTSSTGKTAFRIITEQNFDTYKASFSWSHISNTRDLTYADLNKNTTPIEIDTSTIDTAHSSDDCYYTDLLAYQYQWVKVDLVIRSVSPATDDDQESARDVNRSSTGEYWYKPTTDSKAYTIYAYMVGKDGNKVFTNVRIDNSLTPYPAPALFGTSDEFDCTSDKSPVGKTFTFTGYLARYFEKFQIQLGNNYSSYNYIVAK